MTAPNSKNVLDFWFRSAEEPMPNFDLWFKKSEATDARIRAEYEPLIRTLASGYAHDWVAEGPEGALAAIIVLDQFSRNVYRDTPRAFANDRMALSITNTLMVMGGDHRLHPLQRWFVYMPLEHAEDPRSQAASVAAFTELRDQADKGSQDLFDSALDYALRHAAVIERFGRFPHRNPILGRKSTPEEEAWLAENGGF